MANYNEDIYDQILEDDELNPFMSSIWDYSRKTYNTTIEKLQAKLDLIRIDYSEIVTLIEKLKETGIIITNNDSWFGVENHYTRGAPDREEIENYFFSAKYNDINILDADFVYVLEMVRRKKLQKRIDRFICRSQLEYEDWIHQYKSIDAVEKSLKKLLKKDKKQEKNWTKIWSSYDSALSDKIAKTKEILTTGIELKNKLEFLHGLSDEQMEIMDKIWRVFINICEDYFKKRLEIEAEMEQTEKTRITNPIEFFNKGFLKFIEENGDELNIRSIEIKLTKLLILNSLNRNKETFGDVYLRAHNKTVFEKLIDWFIELKDEETSNTINLFTENIGLILDKQKVLKK